MIATNNLWYISQPYRALLQNAKSKGEMFYKYNEARNRNNPFYDVHINKLTKQAQYELWHQCTLHSGSIV